MKELSILNFKYGLDSRREALTSLLGTLTTCENAHINPGGEVEKRKAFAPLGLESSFQCLYYGMEFTSRGVFVFGSAAPAVDSVLPSLFGDDVTMFYQRLQHPAILEGAVYDPFKHDMNGVKTSTVFNDKPWVAATFNDGNTFAYYDGELIAQSANGLVLAGRDTLSALSEELAAQVNDVIPGWSALSNVDQNGTAQDGTTIVKSQVGVHFTPVTSANSELGLFGANVLDTDINGTPETKASASFTISRSADGTVEVTAPTNQDGTGTAPLTGGPVATAATATLMAAKVAQVINDLTVIHGYTSASNGPIVYVYAPINWGADANTLLVTVNVTGGMTVGAGGGNPVDLVISASPNPAIRTDYHVTGFPPSRTVSITITASVSGGTPPYTYLWTDFGGLNPGTNGNPGIYVEKLLLVGQSISQVIRCSVSDSLANTVSVFVSVQLAYLNI